MYDTAVLTFIVFAFVLLAFCFLIMILYMEVTEPDVLKEDAKLFKEMMED